MKQLFCSCVIIASLLSVTTLAIRPRSDCVPYEQTEKLIDGILFELWQCLSLQYEPISVTVNQDRSSLNGDLEENILVKYYEFHASFGPFIRIQDIVSIKCYETLIVIEAFAASVGFGASLKFNSAPIKDEPSYFGTHFIKENMQQFKLVFSEEKTAGSCLVIDHVEAINNLNPFFSSSQLNASSTSLTSCVGCPEVILSTISADMSRIHDKLFHSIDLAVKYCIANIIKEKSLPRFNYKTEYQT